MNEGRTDPGAAAPQEEVQRVEDERLRKRAAARAHDHYEALGALLKPRRRLKEVELQAVEFARALVADKALVR